MAESDDGGMIANDLAMRTGRRSIAFLSLGIAICSKFESIRSHKVIDSRVSGIRNLDLQALPISTRNPRFAPISFRERHGILSIDPICSSVRRYDGVIWRGHWSPIWTRDYNSNQSRPTSWLSWRAVQIRRWCGQSTHCPV
jgi:hypothetical protein